MATADDRGAVNPRVDLGDAPPARPPNTKRWIWLIVGILLAAFAGVGAVQWQQLQLLNSIGVEKYGQLNSDSADKAE